MDLAPEDVVTAAGRGDLPLPLYIVFVVVGLLIGAVLVTLLVTALVTIIQARWLSLRGKVGWVVGCLVSPTRCRRRGTSTGGGSSGQQALRHGRRAQARV
ncbi:MAG TPA: hypothetical protein VFR46_02170 [Actinomycetes bacterium]|nr:hypothetical protein [Actinomycetes bacterium]